MRRFRLIILALMLAVCSLAHLKPNVCAALRTVEVPIDFPTIQAAINSASGGDTVFVYNGTYNEDLVVNKSISLVGEGENITLIEGRLSGTVIQVTASNVSIAGFTVQDHGSSTGISVNSRNVTIERSTILNNSLGIYLTNAEGIVVSNCTISASRVGLQSKSSKRNTIKDNAITGNGYAGLELSYSDGNVIEDNRLSGNGVYGIYLQFCDGNLLDQNVVANHENGITLEYSENNTLRNNDMMSSRRNFAVEALYLDQFIQQIDLSNTVDGDPVCYFVNQNNVTVNASYADVGYVALVNSSNIQVEGLSLRNNGEGVIAAYTQDSVIERNVINNNTRGLIFYHSNNCTARNNTISDCTESLLVSSSSDTSLEYNEVAQNDRFGMNILASENTSVVNNRITRNGQSGLYAAASYGLKILGNNVSYNGAGVSTGSCEGCEIAGNTISSNRGDGILLSSSSNCMIEENEITSNIRCGTFASNSVSTILKTNNVSGNNEEGLYLYQCDGSQMIGNHFWKNLVGVRVYYSAKCTLDRNIAADNSMMGARFYYSPDGELYSNSFGGNGLEGLSLLFSDRSIVEKNVFYENLHYGAWVENSGHVRVYGNNATLNGWDGIYFQYSNGCTIEYNFAGGNTNAGIGLFYSNQSVISGNEMVSNNDGLQVFASNNNTISNNTMAINTRYGIYLFPSSNNMIYQNNFLNNSQNAQVINAIWNIWNKGYPEGGNFWSDYISKDLYWGPYQNLTGGDGIGDSPYIIDYQNIDRYPLRSFVRVHDVGITDVKTTTDEVYVGRVNFFNVTTRNKGNFVENLTLMLYSNDTLFRSESVKNLPVETDAVVSIVWNTSDLKVGCVYVVRTDVDLSAEDVDPKDNAWTILVRTKMLGDVNGNRQINIIDIAAVAAAFGSHLGEDRYRLDCDMNMDGVINIVDVSVAARNFGLSY